LPVAELELFFDIEVDPMRDLCYLHGIVERKKGDNSTESYKWFFIAPVATSNSSTRGRVKLPHLRWRDGGTLLD
jgi:hypothetical protein